MSEPEQRSAWRKWILASVALVIALALMLSNAADDSWFARRIGRAPRDPFAGLAVLPTPTSQGMITCLPPAAGSAGAVLPPLFRVDLATGVLVGPCTLLIYRDRNGDLRADESEALFDREVGLLPRDDGTFEPGDWSLRVPLEQGAGALRFRVALRVGGDALTWQGEVFAAQAHDPRR